MRIPAAKAGNSTAGCAERLAVADEGPIARRFSAENDEMPLPEFVDELMSVYCGEGGLFEGFLRPATGEVGEKGSAGRP